MNVVTWIVIGIIISIVVTLLYPKARKPSGIGELLLGIMGAVLGGMVANLLFGASITNFNFSSLALAILGSLVLLFAGRDYRRS